MNEDGRMQEGEKIEGQEEPNEAMTPKEMSLPAQETFAQISIQERREKEREIGDGEETIMTAKPWMSYKSVKMEQAKRK